MKNDVKSTSIRHLMFKKKGPKINRGDYKYTVLNIQKLHAVAVCIQKENLFVFSKMTQL